jgi:hypothetical protein
MRGIQACALAVVCVCRVRGIRVHLRNRRRIGGSRGVRHHPHGFCGQGQGQGVGSPTYSHPYRPAAFFCTLRVWARIHAACVGSALRQLGIGADTRATATVAASVVPGGDGDGDGEGCSVVHVRVGALVVLVRVGARGTRLRGQARSAASCLWLCVGAGVSCLCLCLEGAESLPRARRDAGGVAFALSASRAERRRIPYVGSAPSASLDAGRRLVPCAGRLVRSGRYIDPRAVRGPLLVLWVSAVAGRARRPGASRRRPQPRVDARGSPTRDMHPRRACWRLSLTALPLQEMEVYWSSS